MVDKNKAECACAGALTLIREAVHKFIEEKGLGYIEEDVTQCFGRVSIKLTVSKRTLEIAEDVKNMLHNFIVELKKRLSQLVQDLRVIVRGNPRLYSGTGHRECCWDIKFA